MTGLTLFLYAVWALISIGFINPSFTSVEIKEQETGSEEKPNKVIYKKEKKSVIISIYAVIQMLIISFFIINKELHIIAL